MVEPKVCVIWNLISWLLMKTNQLVSISRGHLPEVYRVTTQSWSLKMSWFSLVFWELVLISLGISFKSCFFLRGEFPKFLYFLKISFISFIWNFPLYLLKFFLFILYFSVISFISCITKFILVKWMIVNLIWY